MFNVAMSVALSSIAPAIEIAVFTLPVALALSNMAPRIGIESVLPSMVFISDISPARKTSTANAPVADSLIVISPFIRAPTAH